MISCSDDRKVGELWEQCHHMENPFKDAKCKQMRVLAVKNDYIKFVVLESDYGYKPIGTIDSEHKVVFLINSYRMVEKQDD